MLTEDVKELFFPVKKEPTYIIPTKTDKLYAGDVLFIPNINRVLTSVDDGYNLIANKELVDLTNDTYANYGINISWALGYHRSDYGLISMVGYTNLIRNSVIMGVEIVNSYGNIVLPQVNLMLAFLNDSNKIIHCFTRIPLIYPLDKRDIDEINYLSPSDVFNPIADSMNRNMGILSAISGQIPNALKLDYDFALLNQGIKLFKNVSTVVMQWQKTSYERAREWSQKCFSNKF